MSGLLWSTRALAAVVLLALNAAATAQTVRVNSGASTLEFTQDATFGVVPTSLSSGGHVYTFEPESLWEMELWSRTPALGCPSGNPICDPPVDLPPCFTPTGIERLDASDAANLSIAGGPGGLTFDWTGIVDAAGCQWSVSVDVFPEGVGGFRFDARIDLVASNPPFVVRGVGRLDLPRLQFSDPGPEAALFLGNTGGNRVADPAHLAHASSPSEPIRYTHPDNSLPLVGLCAADGLSVVGMALGEQGVERWRSKEIVAHGKSTQGVFLTFGRFPDDPFQPPSRTVVVGTTVLELLATKHDGSGWFDLAKWYRDEREASGDLDPPNGRGKIAEIQDPLDKAALDYDLLALFGVAAPKNPPAYMESEYERYIARADEIAGYLGIGSHRVIQIWFDWHQNLIGEELPSQMPPVTDWAFVQYVEQAQVNDDYRILPYNSTAIFNHDHPDFCPEQAELWARRLESNEPSVVMGGGGGVPPDAQRYELDFAVSAVGDYLMASTFSKLLAFPGDVSEEHYGVDGTYLDHFPVLKPCYALQDAHHTHPVGGAATHSQGVRDFVDRLEQELELYDRPAHLFAENQNEVLVSELSGANTYYWINGAEIEPSGVGYLPLFPAVYHAYLPITTNSFQDVLTCEDPDICNPPIDGFCSTPAALLIALDEGCIGQATVDLYAREVMMEMSWLWASGHRLFWAHRDAIPGQGLPYTLIDSTAAQGAFAELVEFYRDLFQLTIDFGNRPGLFEGSMEVPPRIVPGTLATVNFEPFSPNHMVPFEESLVPAVFTFAFQEPDGDLLVTFANWTASDQTFDYELDPSWYELPPGPWKVVQSTLAGNVVVEDPLSPGSPWLGQTITIPAESQMVLRFEQ